MQYPQQEPNILMVGGSQLFEKIVLVYRMDRLISALLQKSALLWLGLVLALHFVAWQFLQPIRSEYGFAVIGLAGLVVAIFINRWFDRQTLNPKSTPRPWFDLALRLAYAVLACGLALEYSEVDYLPAIDYLQHLQVRRHLFAPLVASVLICAFGLLITAPIWAEPKLRIYAVALALVGCWVAHATNADGSLLINIRPDIKTEQRATPMRHKNEDSVFNAQDIRALSTLDTPASLNQRVRSRIIVERNWCLLAALVSFGLCLVSVWAMRTWLEGHGVNSRKEFLRIVQYLQECPRTAR